MDKRFQQANKEARLSLALTLIYLLFWVVCSYMLGNELGLFGFPAWFEASCIFVPIGFILLCYWVIKYKFKDLPLDNPVQPIDD